jgi:hypothetical protein
VATFWKPTDAHLARIHLENEGIDVVILDETLVATDWFMANAIGGIKLQVPEPDSVVARSLLTTGGRGEAVGGSEGQADRRAGRERREPAPDGEPVSDGQVLCPRCGSDAIYPARLSRRMAFLAILLLGLPLPMLLRRSRCAGCGFEWRLG